MPLIVTVLLQRAVRLDWPISGRAFTSTPLPVQQLQLLLGCCSVSVPLQVRHAAGAPSLAEGCCMWSVSGLQGQQEPAACDVYLPLL